VTDVVRSKRTTGLINELKKKENMIARDRGEIEDQLPRIYTYTDQKQASYSILGGEKLWPTAYHERAMDETHEFTENIIPLCLTISLK
jgi:hypothetical protein